jgi:hypothetical protein
VKVEALYYGRDKWYPGVICKDCGDGTYDIKYDDGEIEKNVKQSFIRVLGISTPDTSPQTKANEYENSSISHDSIVMGRMTLVDLAGIIIFRQCY